jgi:hypothetical protein
MTFAAAPEYLVFPTPDQPLKPYEAAVLAARTTVEFVRAFSPDVAVSDILTTAPALAAELEDVPLATLIPHVHPDLPPEFPPFSIGARRPRTPVGRAFWRQSYRLVRSASSRGGGSTTAAARRWGWGRCRGSTRDCRGR